MSEFSNKERRNLTFLQAEGMEELPKPLQLKTLSQGLRAAIWQTLSNSIDASSKNNYGGTNLFGQWKTIADDINHRFLKRIDDYMGYGGLRRLCKNFVENKNKNAYARLFDFLQFVIQHPSCPDELILQLKKDFELSRAAYFIDTTQEPHTILPQASEAEGEAIQEAIKTLDSSKEEGALEHIRKSGVAINEGRWADSVKESISAVESTVRKNTGKGSLKDGLTTIENIHPALKEGIVKIYGYTSDENGVRHALIDKPNSEVDEATALYMYGACASLASYLSKKT